MRAMFILMWAGGMPFNGDTIPSGKSLGGSETAAYYMAKELVALGHNVVLFTASQQGGKWDGVTYEWHGQINEQFPLGDRFHFCAQVPFDVAVIQRHPLAYTGFINAKIKVLWNHDLALHRNVEAIHRSIPYLDFIFGVSDWHADQISKTYDIDRKHVLATSNGVDHALFDAIPDQKREPGSLLYTARPERGLENLVKPGGIMEHLPNCKLYVCGYNNTMPNMVDYYQWLWSRCEELPNVVNLGHLGKKELYEWEKKVMLHVYPTTFEDTSCIAAMESQAAGTPFIASQAAALPETCRGAGAVLLPLLNNQGRLSVNEKLFAKTVSRIMQGEREWNDLHKKAIEYKRPWSLVAEQWIQVFKQRFAENCSDHLRLAKHLERMSDVIALDMLANISGAAYSILEKNYQFYLNNTYEDHYKRYYQYEKDRGVVYGPESLDGNNRFEAICTQIRKLIKPDSPKVRILDYGCAHGHYVMNLRKRFSDAEFVGIDIEQTNIDTAVKWAEHEKADNVSFVRATSKDIDPEAVERFDIVMANEVLEHVPDVAAVVTRLKQLIKPGGAFIASVPYGPWEAIGYGMHPGWRAHLHHFERQDIVELFGEQPEFQNIAVPHSRDLGHFLILFKEGGPGIGRIDYGRKLSQQAPRQTVSVCMIVKDEEYNIARCLSKLKPIADEIIIAVDKTTRDRTVEVIERFHPEAQITNIESPLIVGFDGARNLSIKEAEMDWVLWVDADEQLENAPALEKYLRESPVDGIAIAQHHLGVNPPGVQKTDFPCRMFRNHRNVRFFGVVHEHPEKALNSGVGKIIIAHETAIGHYGYSTEGIRRKRFERNFPLMERDRKQYPTRKLGTMLWVRDLAHIVRYEKEVHGQVTKRAMMAAKEAMDTWRSMLEWPDGERSMRMIVESLSFYSECVHALYGGGIQLALNIGAALNQNVELPREPMVGLFASPKDAKRLIDLMAHEVLEPTVRKYN